MFGCLPVTWPPSPCCSFSLSAAAVAHLSFLLDAPPHIITNYCINQHRNSLLLALCKLQPEQQIARAERSEMLIGCECMYIQKQLGFFFFFHFKCACHRFPLVNCCLSVFRSVHSCICTYVLWDFYLQVTSEHLLLRRCFYWHVGRFIDLFVVALSSFFFFFKKKKYKLCMKFIWMHAFWKFTKVAEKCEKLGLGAANN